MISQTFFQAGSRKKEPPGCPPGGSVWVRVNSRAAILLPASRRYTDKADDGIDDKVLRPRVYYHAARAGTGINVSGLFTDKDGSETLAFTAKSKSEYVRVVGITKTTNHLIVDVVKLMGSHFTVTVTATDDMKEAVSVDLNIKTDLPIAETYPVRQFANDAFSDITVMERQGVEHTLEFLAPERLDGGQALIKGFGFALKHLAGDTSALQAGQPPKEDDVRGDNTKDGLYYTASTTGPLSVVRDAAMNDLTLEDPDRPTLRFMLNGYGKATVTITVHVVSEDSVDTEKYNFKPASQTFKVDDSSPRPGGATGGPRPCRSCSRSRRRGSPPSYNAAPMPAPTLRSSTRHHGPAATTRRRSRPGSRIDPLLPSRQWRFEASGVQR